MKKILIMCGTGVATSTVVVNKVKKWLEINNLSNKANAHEIVKSMQEFNQANLYYKQFSELANSFTNPELQYSTYKSI